MAKIETKNLIEKLETLRGLDFEAAEAEERAAGNTAVEMTFSKSFQVRLAAKALGANVHDLKSLPLKDYYKITSQVSRFLFTGLEEEEIPSEKSENSPQN